MAYPDPGPAYATERSGDRYVQRDIDRLFNSYADASVAFKDAVNVALEALAECAPVSVEDEDNLILQVRETLDEMFHDAAKRLDTEHNIDGSDVLSQARQQNLFDGEAGANARWDAKWKAQKAAWAAKEAAKDTPDTGKARSCPEQVTQAAMVASLKGGA